MRNADSRSTPIPVLVPTVVTAGLLLWASFHPTSRVWGLSVWAYLEVWQRVALFVVLILATAVILWQREPPPGRIKRSEASHGWALVAVAAVAGVVLFIFRTQAHFLGDGYLLLKSLGSDNPLIRGRNYGEMLIHIWIKNALPMDSQSAALASFRIVSIGAGVLHTTLAVWLAPRIVDDRRHAWLLALGMMTGGYALLYFGYVENYSLFGVAVAVYVYTGILISMGKLNRAWILLAFAATVFFHALGLSLAVPTVYLLLSQTSWSARLSRQKGVVRVLLTVLSILAMGAVAYVALKKSLFLRLAIVPLSGDWWILEGYSMFSWPHLADMANLLFLLVPGLLILMVATGAEGWRRCTADPRLRFLAATSLAVLTAVFVFEAKIGMPRDWDLFSFAGYPWVALLLLAVLTSAPAQQAQRAVLASIVVAVSCLVPRVVTANTPTRAIEQFRDYAEIDIRKNRSGWYVLLQYYGERADSTAYWAVADLRSRRFTEEAVARAADSALMRRSVDSAMMFDRIALRINRTHSSSWANLGSCFLEQGQYDSAVYALEVANALNPDVSRDVSHLGLAYFFASRFDEAEESFLDAYRLDSMKFEPVMALARLYQKQGKLDNYLVWLSRAAYRKEAEGIWATELGDAYLARGNMEGAARAYSVALAKGSDSVKILQRLEAHPELKYQLQR